MNVTNCGITIPTIHYSPGLRIANADCLPPCKGARYLECVPDHQGGYIAAQWRRKFPASVPTGRVVVVFPCN